jgi:hypothetical protein
LDLPDEVLWMILSYVPNQLLVGQTCRKFYDVSCSLETFSLTIETTTLDGDPSMNVTEFLENESIFASIVNSKRRIENLELVGLNLYQSNIGKLQAVVENIGARIKQLTISNCRLSMAEIALLNLMPQLKHIDLGSVQLKNIWSVSNFQLNLPKLKMIEIINCAEAVLEVFDQLTDDVLGKVSLCNIKAKSPKKHFANQRKLKSLSVISCSYVPLEIDLLNLEELLIFEVGQELKPMLQRKSSLKTFLHKSTSQADFNFICSHLLSLDRLEIVLPENNINFSELADLKKLKTFEVQLINESALRTIKSYSVETLKINLMVRTDDGLRMENLTEATIKALSTNCPSVVELSIGSLNEEDAINWCLQNFPQLKTFSCSSINGGHARYTFPCGLQHLNLKKLEVMRFHRSLDMHFLFNCLENLEVFKTDQEIDWHDLQMTLGAPKLKALCLNKLPVVNEEFIRTMKKYGKSLESFHVHHCYEEEINVDLSPEELREEFKDQFPVFSFITGKKWLMKKSNKKICCDESTIYLEF